MQRLVWGILLIVSAIILFIVYRNKARGGTGSRGSEYGLYYKWGSLALSIISGIIGVCLFLSLSFVTVGGDELGHMNMVFWGEEMPAGQIIALDGQKGPQAKTLPPGFHFSPFIRLIYKIDMKKDVVVPNGFCAKLIAKDGKPIREGESFADEWSDAESQKMLDAEYFLSHGGQKGPQVSVLKPGTWKVNQYLFDVFPTQPVTVIAEGFVGVVKSNVQKPNLPVIKKIKKTATDPRSAVLKAQVVSRGYRGVWDEVYYPGKYYINTDAFSVIPVDVRVQTWTYIGGFQKRTITITSNQDGIITQTEKQEQIPIIPTAADMAISVKVQGFDIFLDSRILIQVDPEDAPYVVASVGNIEEIENNIITPTYRSILRNVCGKEDVTVLSLVNNRAVIEDRVETSLIPEGDKAYITIKEVRFGEPSYPPEYFAAIQRKEIATQLLDTFKEETKAQDQRIETEKSRALGDQQPVLIAAQISKGAAEFEKDAERLRGEGEKLRLQEVAIGQKAQADVLGQERVVQITIAKMALEAAQSNPEIVKVPVISVQGSGSGFEGAAAILGGASNIASFFPSVSAPQTEQAK